MRILDDIHAVAIAGAIVEALYEAGYTDEREIIPGLVQAIIELAAGNEQLLDEAGNLLADGGV